MIFGTTNFTYDHVTYSHKETTTDEAVNYLFALVAILSMLLGVVCNVAVFYYNTAVNSRTVASIIYRCIAVWDLAVCLVKCPQQIYNLLKPELSPFYHDTVSPFQRILSVFTLSESLIMGALISLLAVTRFTFLILPIWSYVHKTGIKRAVLLYMIIVHTVTTAVFIKNLTGHVYWFGPCQWAIRSRDPIVLGFWINFVFYLNLGAGVLFSLLTAGWIVWRSRKNAESEVINQGSGTILLMNCGLVLFLVLWVFLDRDLPQNPANHMARYIDERYYMYYVYYLISTLFPMVLAAYNPLVICIRCRDLRLRIVSLGSGWRSGEVRGTTDTTNIFSR